MALKAQLFDGSGAAVSPVLAVGNATAIHDLAVTATEEGGFAISWSAYVWEDKGFDWMQYSFSQYDASGAFVAGDDAVLDIIDWSSAPTQAGSLPNAVRVLGDGRVAFLDAWPDGITLRLLEQDGSAVGAPIIVANPVLWPEAYLHAMPDGGVSVVWWEPSSAGATTGTLYFRVVDAEGAPSGAAVTVSATPMTLREPPAFAMLDDGSIVVAWRSDDPGDGSGSALRARIFGADGMPAGLDFVLPTTIAGHQFAPSIAALEDGRFITVWMSEDGSIRAQLADTAVFSGPDGTAFRQGIDRIDISDIDALSGVPGIHHFAFIGTAPHNGAGGTLRYQHGNGPTWVYGDVDGDRVGDFAIRIDGIHHLTAADFTLSSITRYPGTPDNDVLVGLDGNDTIDGGLGYDTMSGGGGADRFVFRSAAEIGWAAGSRDVITDFRQGEDLIDLSVFDADPVGAGRQSFAWIGANAHPLETGTLRYYFSGGNTLVTGDLNGDGIGDWMRRRPQTAPRNVNPAKGLPGADRPWCGKCPRAGWRPSRRPGRA